MRIASVFWMVERLVPFLLNKYFKFNENKNGTQRLYRLRLNTMLDFRPRDLGYVDDKNCLAQLTVALKFNQGVRQRLYIVAGVLFFGTFFCTSKRKYMKLINPYAYFLP